MSEVNSSENQKHAEANGMTQQYWNPGDATVNTAFQASETSDNAAPPSYDEAGSMPFAGGDIKGTLPTVEPVATEPAVVPIQLNSIPLEQTNPVIVTVAPTAQHNVNVNPYILGAFPVMVTCQNCQQTVSVRFSFTIIYPLVQGQTVVEKRRGVGNWVGCGAMCLFGCWLGCQFIPFCIDDLKDSVHHCPHCNAVIGVRSAF